MGMTNIHEKGETAYSKERGFFVFVQLYIFCKNSPEMLQKNTGASIINEHLILLKHLKGTGVLELEHLNDLLPL